VSGGGVPMPAQSQLSKENAELMARWIADGAK
jgi:cytochrome c551/c552